jgi:riboflavin synthase
MFTGIIQSIGTLRRVDQGPAGLELECACPWDDLILGESVAVDGACLTVERTLPGAFTAHVVPSTLTRTRFGSLAQGHRANLERALRAGDRLGGHLVQGHVDGVGTVQAVEQDADSWLFDIALPADLVPVCIPLGSITVDGVSLTLASVDPEHHSFTVALIPTTLKLTTLGNAKEGDIVNIECDMLAKTIVHVMNQRSQSMKLKTQITVEALKEAGFA